MRWDLLINDRRGIILGSVRAKLCEIIIENFQTGMGVGDPFLLGKGTKPKLEGSVVKTLWLV